SAPSSIPRSSTRPRGIRRWDPKNRSAYAAPSWPIRWVRRRLEEDIVELLRAQQERRDALIINDPQPLASIAELWGSAAQMATVGIFVLLLVTCLYFCRPILLPVLAAVLIGTTFAPILKHASNHGISPW